MFLYRYPGHTGAGRAGAWAGRLLLDVPDCDQGSTGWASEAGGVEAEKMLGILNSLP